MGMAAYGLAWWRGGGQLEDGVPGRSRLPLSALLAPPAFDPSGRSKTLARFRSFLVYAI